MLEASLCLPEQAVAMETFVLEPWNNFGNKVTNIIRDCPAGISNLECPVFLFKILEASNSLPPWKYLKGPNVCYIGVGQ